MKRSLFLLLLLWSLIFLPSQAQVSDLVAENLRIETRLDAFGVETQVLVGQLRNTSTTAYTGIEIYADVTNRSGEVIGEGFGYLVNECGTALTDFVLVPQASQAFLATVDLFREGTSQDAEIFPEATPSETEVIAPAPLDERLTEVTRQEVVSVQWETNQAFRYGVGCDSELFTTYDWFRYHIPTQRTLALDAHPNAAALTEAFIRQTGINQVTQGNGYDATLLARSYLTFPVETPRIVYQTDIHSLMTAEQDGSFKRIIHTNLSRNSLQGFVWSPVGNFVAYYFGAYGEPVRYFTVSPQNGLIGGVLQNNTPSATVPGLVNDGQRVIISGTFPNGQGEDVTGYFFSNVVSQQRELLFEVEELAGNNYPAPAYFLKDNQTRYVYIIRPVDGAVRLECFYREEERLTTIATLPFQLDSDSRAWSWLAPNGRTLAVGANGAAGGLWLVDLTALADCPL